MKITKRIILTDSVKVVASTNEDLEAKNLSDSIPQRLSDDTLLPNPVIFHDEVKGDKFLDFGRVSMGSILTLDNYRKVIFRKLLNEKTIDKIDMETQTEIFCKYHYERGAHCQTKETPQ